MKALTEEKIPPLLVSKKSTRQVLGDISARSVDYLISSGELETRIVGRRRLVLYSSLVKFCKRDHPGPVAGTAESHMQPEPVPQPVAAGQ